MSGFVGRLTTGRSGFVASAVVVSIGLLGASPAGAAVTIGETFAPPFTCSSGATLFVSGSPPAGPSYAVPTSGVITSWSFQTNATPATTMRFKVGRGTPTSLTTVARGPLEVPEASTVNTFPVRAPVQAGDVIGFSKPAGDFSGCGVSVAGFTFSASTIDTALGSTDTFVAIGARAPISAQLEPDADGDGFGDETQDLCPSDADTVKACRDKEPPETTITAKPKKKVKKKKAVFEFTSSEAGATFRCSLNGAAFSSCTSPASLKASSGRNTFTVFAKDAAGNVDDSPATYSWNFKKKKKK